MFKKILIYTGYFLVTAALAVYFYFSSALTSSQCKEITCNRIEVIIKDSAQNRFVSRSEIVGLLEEEGIRTNESKIKHINQHKLELAINNRTAVKVSHVSVTRSGKIQVQVTQRRPIIRIETTNGGFYMDDSAYVFPLIRSFTSYVPVVSGNVPLPFPPGFRGNADLSDKWASGIYQLALYMDNNQEWNTLIEQIYIDSKGVMTMTPRAGITEIIFGSPENIDYKFSKLNLFYTKVIPAKGWYTYKTVDLSFDNQLVCKLNDKKNNKQIKT
jgi:cell division protein FtsQ